MDLSLVSVGVLALVVFPGRAGSKWNSKAWAAVGKFWPFWRFPHIYIYMRGRNKLGSQNWAKTGREYDAI